MGFNNWTRVKKFCHGDTLGTPNPCPLDLNEETQESGSTKDGSGNQSTQGSHPTENSRDSAKQGSNPNDKTPEFGKQLKKSTS